MKITYYDKVTDDMWNEYDCFTYVDLLGSRERQAILDTDDKYSDEAVSLLNLINEQGIEKISFRQFCYTVNGKQLGLNKMSTAEKFFLISFCYMKNKRPAMFIRDIMQLSKRVQRIYVKAFKKADNIILCIENKYRMEFLLEDIGDIK